MVQIIDESTGIREHRFLNGPYPNMVLVDEVFTGSGTPSDILWLLHDHQHSVTDVATIGATGQAQLRNHIEYNAFGQVTTQTNSAYEPLQTYTGQNRDSATGLLYYDARWFDPRINQFVSEDPLGFAAGDPNLRRYVGNSDPNGVDPTGLETFMFDVGRAAADEAAVRRERRRQFRDAMVKSRNAIEMINRRARLIETIVKQDLAKQGCVTTGTLYRVLQLAEEIGLLTAKYIEERNRATELGGAYYGYGVTGADITEFLNVPLLPARFWWVSVRAGWIRLNRTNSTIAYRGSVSTGKRPKMLQRRPTPASPLRVCSRAVDRSS